MFDAEVEDTRGAKRRSEASRLFAIHLEINVPSRSVEMNADKREGGNRSGNRDAFLRAIRERKSRVRDLRYRWKSRRDLASEFALALSLYMMNF